MERSIIDVKQTEISIALMENHRLMELNKEAHGGKSYNVGDVYLGKVKKFYLRLTRHLWI